MDLGDTARDTITGFTGVIISRHEYLNGCVRLSLQPKQLKDGKPIECQTFDVEQLELKAKGPRRSPKPTGGPFKEPARPATPAR